MIDIASSPQLIKRPTHPCSGSSNDTFSFGVMIASGWSTIGQLVRPKPSRQIDRLPQAKDRSSCWRKSILPITTDGLDPYAAERTHAANVSSAVANRGPFPLHLYALRDQHTPLGPKGPG